MDIIPHFTGYFATLHPFSLQQDQNFATLWRIFKPYIRNGFFGVVALHKKDEAMDRSLKHDFRDCQTAGTRCGPKILSQFSFDLFHTVSFLIVAL
jgi:hypothetical protein